MARVRRGDRVVIKVNTNSGDPYPYSSSPLAVGWLSARLRDMGARVVVGDRSFFGDDDTAGNLERNGIAPAARAAGAEVVVFEDVAWVEIPPSLVPSWRPPVRVPRLVVEAEHLINLACVKTHFISGCTLTLKNLLGVVRAEDRARPGNLRSHDPARLPWQVAELHHFVRPGLHVLDGWRALVAGGPTPGSGRTPVIADARRVLAGPDPVALDVLGIELLQRFAPPEEAVTRMAARRHPSILAAQAMGIGGVSGAPGAR